MTFFLFGIKVLKRFLILIVAEWAGDPVNPPRIPTIRTEEKSFSHFFLQQA
jgi:hypothetical protein